MSDNFWSWFFDPVDANTRRAINDVAADIANSRATSNLHLASQMKKLYTLDRAQERELERMRAVIQILTEQVVELGADRDAIEVRIQGAMERLEQDAQPKPQPSKTGGSPYRGALPSATAIAEPTGTCTRCDREVLLRRTEFLSSGTVCDRCIYSGTNG